MKLSVIITGVTGMVGEGVLHECLNHPDVEKILVLTRRPSGITHAKITEVIYENFFDLSPVADRLSGYNTCFFCLGVTSMGKNEKEYTRLTHTLTLHAAQILAAQNKDMTFCYISGAGTDSSEKGRIMWARVKGKTENDLMKLPFKKVYAVRPGYLHPTPGLKYTQSYYKYFKWMYPLLILFAPYTASTLKELGLAMIKCASIGYSKKVLEVKDIKLLAGNREKENKAINEAR